MKKLYLILLLFYIPINAQNYYDSLKTVEDYFKSFKYAEVIKRTPSLLMYGTFSEDTVINIYMMKGISHYALQEDTLAKNSFHAILKLNPDYNPDSVTISPKIVSFFASVKDQLKNSSIKSPTVIRDTVFVKIIDRNTLESHSQKVKGTLFRSIIFPGLGHIYANSNKGWYLAAAGGITLISSIYYVIETNSRKNDYLQETDLSVIPAKFDEYNTSYKLRNISLIAYGAIWLFSQIDLLTSSVLDYPEEAFTITPLANGINFSLNLPF